MTNSDLYLLTLPVIGYGVLAIVAVLSAWDAVRRHPKKSRAHVGASSIVANDPDIDRALNNLSVAIAKRNRGARL